MTAPSPLAVTLPTDREIHVTRMFNAPRELVWKAHTTPELMKRWLLGPPGWEMPECVYETKEGGRFHYTWRNIETGDSFSIGGQIVKYEPPGRIVHTETMEMPGQPPTEAAYVVTEFLAEGDRTRMTMTMRFASKEARDGAAATGMTDGMEQSYKLLDGLFEEKAVAA